MAQTETNIDKFFKDYESNFNKGLSGANVDAIVVKSFSDCFVESSPAGVNCGRNDESLPAKMRQGFEFYKGIGTTSMKITSKKITELDSAHSLVKVGWHYEANRKDGSKAKIDFDVFYLLRTFNNEVKIFAYIAGDEQKALKENGLLPGSIE